MLHKGVVDGSSHPMESNKGWKLGEVVHYMVQNFSTAYTTTFAVFMNKDKWNALSPEHQKIILEINAVYATKHGEAWDDADKKGLAFFKEKGGKVIIQSDAESKKWADKAAVVVDDYVKSVSAKGIDGQAVVDVIKSSM